MNYLELYKELRGTLSPEDSLKDVILKAVNSRYPGNRDLIDSVQQSGRIIAICIGDIRATCSMFEPSQLNGWLDRAKAVVSNYIGVDTTDLFIDEIKAKGRTAPHTVHNPKKD